MRNIKVKCAFVGTAYHGFQRQNNASAVQNEIEKALSLLTREEVSINGCSRTDTGVHANEFYFSFRTGARIPCPNIVTGANRFLPGDIRFYTAEEAEDDFHARYSCTGKEYIYLIENTSLHSPFLENRVLNYPYPLDENRLDGEIKKLIGTHDFSSFCGALGKKENSVRTLYSADVTRNEDMVTIRVHGDGFLYNMVRIIVGTLIYINENRIENMESVLSARNRECAGITALPQGLYLNKVYY